MKVCVAEQTLTTLRSIALLRTHRVARDRSLKLKDGRMVVKKGIPRILMR